jgi:multidrug efflux pump subunit AcrB
VRSAGPVGGVLDAVPLRRLTVEVRGEDRAAVGASALQVAAGLQRAGLPVLALLPPRVSTLEARPTELGWRHGALLPSLIEAALPAADGVAIGQIRVDESALATRDPGEIEIRWRELRAPLSSFANLVAVERPAVLERRGGQPVVQLTVGEATADVSRLASLLVEFRTGLASSVAVRASGGVLDWIEARSELVLAFVLGLLLVFLVVMGVYESFRFAAAIMAVLPIAVLGGLVAQRVAGAGLDLGAGLGFVLLGGMAVDSGVLLLDRMRGCEAGPAWMARRAAGRLRPVAVTTLTTVATMAPVALAGGAGSSLRVTLARTACAGLLLAIPTNLLVLPALARLLGGLRGNAEGPSS